MSDIREIVRYGYENGDYARVYREGRTLTPLERRFLEGLLELVPDHPNVLDLGCGPGIPYGRFLVDRGCRLTGVDISSKHLAAARKNLPEATFIEGDFSKIELPGPFDAVLSLYSIFHVPKEEHEALLQRVAGRVTDSGALLLTVAGRASEHRDANWLGAPMAWSSFEPETYLALLERTGFHVERTEFEGTATDEDFHLWILARKHSPSARSARG